MNLPSRLRGSDRQQGFTLIELSIVIVVIGLLVGGALVGQDLIKAAQQRSVYTEFTAYQTAMHTFRLKYNCLPGDCREATNFFGIQDPANCNSPANSGTCNGNGDKKIGLNSNINSSFVEGTNFFRQLALDGLIKGEYVGGMSHDGSSRFYAAGVNVPIAPAAYSNSIFAVDTCDQDILCFNQFMHKNYLSYRRDNYTTVNGEQGNWFTEDAYRFDQKFDDGYPHTGKIGTTKRYSNYLVRECITNNTTPEYDLTDYAKPWCILYLMLE